MSSFDDGFSRLEEAMERSPLEFPVGFFLQDKEPYAPGGFFWYKTEEDVMNAIRNDMFSVFDQEEDADEIKSKLSVILTDIKENPRLSEALRKRLDDYLTEAGYSMEFLGTFNQICEDQGEWESEVRRQFRENYFDDAENMPDEKLMSPLKKKEVTEFAEYIADFRY